MAQGIIGDLQRLSLDQLRPDWGNPRFLPGAADLFATDEDVYAFLDAKYDAFAVAESIARHGYFEAEPLIAIAEANSETFTVVEGNRRLTALKALADPAIRKLMKDRRWGRLPHGVVLPERLPVVVVDSRDRVAPLLGFRHVTGISSWDPYQQALYVASMIDGSTKLDAHEVAELIGRDVGEVRAFYRNISILEQAEEEFGIADTKRVVDEFGVWNRAMTSPAIRSYIGAPPPRAVVERTYPLGETERANLERLILWIFGEPRSDADQALGRQSRQGRAISDSRHLGRLGKAMQHPRGLAALESGENLEAAERVMLNERAQFSTALTEARDALGAASKHRPKRLPTAARQLLNELADTVEQLRGDDGDSAA